MERIAKIYGAALLYGVCLVATLLMVFHSASENGNESMLERMGEKISVAWSKDSAGGFDTYQAESGESFPDIEYQAAGALPTGTYELEEVVKAFDGAGNLLDCEVCSIRYPDGTKRAELTQASLLTFEKAGVYELELKAKDADNRKIIKCIKIPVNEQTGW